MVIFFRNIGTASKVRLLFFVTLFVVCSALDASAQRRNPAQISLENVVRLPIDTIKTDDSGTCVIIYSNNTWRFHHPQLDTLDNLSIYRYNWDTLSIFSYRNIELSDMAPVIEMRLVDSLRDFSAPIVGKIFSRYGPRGRWGRNHNGVDIPLKVGEPILSTFDGKVRYARYNTGGFGYMVIIRHKNGLESYSAHLSRLNVKTGDIVKAGQIIGFGGNTGRSRGPHLHFEMRYQDQAFDPEYLIDFESGSLRYMTFALEKEFFNIRSRASEELEEGDDDYIEVNEILAMANDSTGKQLASGDAARPKSSVDNVYHKITSGDMLGKIALTYGVSVNQICRLNNISRTTILQLGRKLRIK